MKKLFFGLFTFALLITGVLQAGGLKHKQGIILTYEVNDKGNTYEIEVSNIQVQEAGIRFAYRMTDEARTTGTVTIPTKALNHARNQTTQLTGGKLNLKKSTAVWCSKLVFSELKEGTTLLHSDDKSIQLDLQGKSKFEVEIDGETKPLRILYATDQHGHKFWIQNKLKNPLIVRLELDYTITLVAVSTSSSSENS